MHLSRFILLVLCAFLLAGCPATTPYIEFYNYSGQDISILDKYSTVRVPNGAHKQIRFVGRQQAGKELTAPVIHTGDKQWSYAVSANERSLLPPTQAYWRNSGSDHYLSLGLDQHGYLYLLPYPSDGLASRRDTQPSGFPLKPL